MKYTEKVMNTVNGAVAKFGAVSTKTEDVEKQYLENRITGSVYSEKKEELRREREAVYFDALQQIEATKAAYSSAVERATELSGSMLHEDAALLTTPGLTLTAHQFTALVERHKENPLMVQILKDYSNSHKGLYADFIPGADEKISGFSSFCDAATNCLRSPDSMSAAFFLDGKYTPNYCTEEE